MSLFVDVLESLMVKPADMDPGDYVDADGLICCGKCRKQKQMFLQILPTEPMRKVNVSCDCMKAKYEAIKRMDELQQRRTQISEILEHLRSIGAADMPTETIRKDDGRSRRNTNIVTHYVSKFETIKEQNMGLMLYGDVGCGKTFLASCIMNALLEKGCYVWMTSVRAIQAAIDNNRGEQRSYVLRQIRSADLLVLDDYGTERGSDYMIERVYEVINERYKVKKPLILTTNLDPRDMAQPGVDLSQRRINQRLLEMCTPVKVEGGSRRMAAAATKQQTMKSLLELE